MTVTTSKSNVALTTDQQLTIAERKKSNPRTTNQELALWAKDQFKLFKAPDISTISKVLKRQKLQEQTQTSNIDTSRKRQRKAEHPVCIFTVTFNMLNYYYLACN